MKQKTTSKLKRPELKTSPSGERRYYDGCLSAQAGQLMSSKQELQILRGLREPRHLSELVVSDLSPFNPHHQESIRRYIAKLDSQGLAALARDGKKVLGWKLSESGELFLKGLEGSDEE
jgi:hypothetical protein